MPGYEIISDTEAKDTTYTPRGGARELIYSREPEVILSGPAETGKTLANCWKLHLLACKYPGSQWAIVRKTQRSVYGSVLKTWDRVITGAPVKKYGGEKPEKYIYNNGSVVWVGGLDNPAKILSSERDGIYVNQAEECSLNDWELITTRTTGRGAVVPHPQAFGDCNPGGSQHWILQRSRAGRLVLLKGWHEDNPTLFDEAGVLTEQGVRSMAALDALTGVRYKRLRLGLWATSEGAVYDMFDGTPGGAHVMERKYEEMKEFYLAGDEGFTNPATILLVGIDADGRMHIFKEFYERGKLQADVVAEYHSWYSADYAGKRVSVAVVDEAAAGLIADLIDKGVAAVGEKGRVLDGINLVQNRLKVAGDGRARLTVDPSCVNAINEFESYVWKPEKDEPVKEFDHTLDALRYLVYYIDRGVTWYML